METEIVEVQNSVGQHRNLHKVLDSRNLLDTNQRVTPLPVLAKSLQCGQDTF